MSETFSSLQSSLNAAETMHAYWGNVVMHRHLILHRFVAKASGQPEPELPTAPKEPDLPEPYDFADCRLDARTNQIVAAALLKFNGNVRHAAKYLGIGRETIYFRLRKAKAKL